MDTIVDYGTDISSDWSFTNGDLTLVSNKDNICQMIFNRLNTIADSLNIFYEDYGSLLQYFLGWRRTEQTLEFIKVEVDSCISKDPRIKNFESDVSFSSDGSVEVNIYIYYIDENFELNYVLNDDGVEVVE